MSESPASAGLPRATVWGLPNWFLGAYRVFVIVILFLIALGGSVRVMNAGLACPDWPLCFGDVIPDYHPQVYFEFIHRVLAGLVSLMFFGFFVMLVSRPKVPSRLKWIAIGALNLLATQVVMGGLTVLLHLKAGVVATHLGMGTAFFALNVWIYQCLAFEPDEGQRAEPKLRKFTWILLAAVYLQIILGGMVAAHYAANVCPGEFPTCHGQLFPTFEGQIGLHIMHRTWGYAVFVLGLVGLFLIRAGKDRKLKSLSSMLFGVIVCQIAIGIANVMLYTPPLIAVIHLAFATKILWVAVRMVHRSRGVAV